MNLETACTNLIRYLEDHRDDFRDKPPKTSWYQYLNEDLYAKKMLAAISKEASSAMRTSEQVKSKSGQYVFVKNRIELPQTNPSPKQGMRDHKLSIADSSDFSGPNTWAKGAIILDIVMSPKYTAGVRILF